MRVAFQELQQRFFEVAVGYHTLGLMEIRSATKYSSMYLFISVNTLDPVLFLETKNLIEQTALSYACAWQT